MNEARALLEAIEQIHQERQEGRPPHLVHSYCVEDRQLWPCATMRAVTDVEKRQDFSHDVRSLHTLDESDMPF